MSDLTANVRERDWSDTSGDGQREHEFGLLLNVCRNCGLPAWGVEEAQLPCESPTSHPRKLVNLAIQMQVEGRGCPI